MLRGVFEGSALENVELPKTLERIVYNVFYGCKNLKNILLPDGLEFIVKDDFFNIGLARISLPKSMIEM